MKKLGCALLVVGVAVVAVIGFFALVGSSLLNTDDQSALTSEVTGDLVDSERVVARRSADWDYDYNVVYTYRIAGQAYRGDDRLSGGAWEPGDPLAVCVDPDEPTEHAVRIEAEPCGSESVNDGKTSTGIPTSDPG